MPLIRITALQQITIIDPYPYEGVATVTIQLAPGEYREYPTLEQQSERLIPLLNRAQNQGFITYDILRDTGGSLTIQDEGITVENKCSILNIVGGEVQAIAEGGNKVTIYHPPPTYSPFLGSGQGALQWPTTSLGVVSRPEGGPGHPYFTNGWDDRASNRPRLNTTQVDTLKLANTGLGITHTSARVTGLSGGTIRVSLTDGQHNEYELTLNLSPLGGDQTETSHDNNLSIAVRNTVKIGATIEGKVYIKVNVYALLRNASSGSGGYFRLRVVHSGSPVVADLGEVFWDAGTLPSLTGNPTVVPVTPVPIYISGIRYFFEGSTFRIEDAQSTLVSDIVNQTINQNLGILIVDASEFNTSIGLVPYTDSGIEGLGYAPSHSCYRTDKARYSKLIIVGSGDFLDIDARVRTTWLNFHGNASGSPRVSSSGIYMISTTDGSTDSTETFDVETYRLRNEDFINLKQAISDYRAWFGKGGADFRTWDETQSVGGINLQHEGLQFYAGRLVYPTLNFSTGYYFSDFNYTTVAGNKSFLRAFSVGDLLNHKKFQITLEVSGITTSHIAIGSGFDDSTAVRIDLLFPGPERVSPNGSNSTLNPGSGWLHCGKAYNSADFNGETNDGILESIAVNGSSITLVVVTENFTTEYTQGTVILRVRYSNRFVGTIGQITVVGV